MFPTITFDFSFFSNIVNEILSSKTPLDAVWIVLKIGGWIPLAYLLLWAAKEIYLINIRNKWGRKQKFVLLAIDVPKGNEQSPKAVESIFSNLCGAKASSTFKKKWVEGRFNLSFSLEMVSHGGDIRFYIRAPLKHRDLVEASVFSQYPDAAIVEAEDYAKDFPRKFPNDNYKIFGCDFKQDRDFIYPIRTYPVFEHSLSGEFKDPASLLMETLGKIDKKQWVCLQIIVTPSGDDWRKAGMVKLQKLLGKTVKEKKTMLGEAVGGVAGLAHEMVAYATGFGSEADPYKKDKKDDPLKMLNMSPGERRVLENIEYKLAKIGLISKIRYMQFGPPETFSPKYYEIKGYLRQFAALDSNGFGAVKSTLTKADYFWEQWLLSAKQRALMKSYIQRDSQRGGPTYPLNVEELATIWHFPDIGVKAPLVKKTEAKRAEPPRGLPIR